MKTTSKVSTANTAKKTVEHKEFTKEQALRTLKLFRYSEKSFALIGEDGSTFALRKELSALGGRFNRGLRINTEIVAGWIFSEKHLAELKSFVKSGIAKATPAKETKPAVVHKVEQIDLMDTPKKTTSKGGNGKAKETAMVAMV